MRRMLAMFGVVGALLVAAAPAWAQYPPGNPPGTPGPNTNVSDTTISEGESITVNGGGWQPGSTVTIEGCGLEAVTATADANGNFSHEVTIPAGQDPGLCALTISGTGVDGRARTVEQRMNIGGTAAEAAPEAPAAREEVANTGLDADLGVLVGMTMLLLGFIALYTAGGATARRRA